MKKSALVKVLMKKSIKYKAKEKSRFAELTIWLRKYLNRIEYPYAKENQKKEMKDKQTNKMHLAQENIYIEQNINIQRKWKERNEDKQTNKTHLTRTANSERLS